MLYLRALFILAFWLILNSSLWAADTFFSAYLKVRGEYNDNVTFTYYNPEEDFLSITSPSLFFNYKSERFSWYSRAGLDIYDYMDLDRLDTVNQHYEIKTDYQWRDRWRFSGQAYVIKDTTLESELQETGIVRFREDRRRYYFSLGVTHLLTELTQLNFNFVKSRTEYDWQYNVDYDYSSASLSFQRRLRNRRDVLMSRFYYTNIDSDTSKVDNYGFLLGWQRFLSETSGFTAFAGVRYTSVDYFLYYRRLVVDPRFWPPFRVILEKRKQTDEEWSYLADISFHKKGERSTYRLGLNNDLSYSSFGEAVDRTRIYGRFSYKLRPRWSFLFSAGYYLTSSKGRVYEEDNIFYYLRPSLKYLLTERWSLELAYSYSDYRDKVRDHEYDRHQIWMVLTFEFGKPPALGFAP
ncbi:hypothetical protein [Thermosulfurimonas dismutans]|uniref:hypothetical protein n=1 Tax=Thermosulfurimonas dismutans TaxID=999894 RepID=UPI00129464D1|nr:hypothetical protein [Thermosulfurimonas dismutans]